jgi:RNA polymerase sigma-70 factor (ECF subfamily)
MIADPCLPCVTPKRKAEPELRAAFEEEEDGLVVAFNEVRGKLFGKLYAMLGNYADTQDALQLAFLHCWRARARVGEVHNLRAWIWRVGLNAGRDLRDLVWRRRAKPLDVIETTACCRGTSPADALVNQERLERLRAALVHLRPEERDILLLRQNGELTYEEIGQQRGIPVGTAKTLMRKAVHKLRRVLGEAASN